jgi:hypothetical protein
VSKFFNSNTERFFRIGLYYILGPVLALLYGFKIVENAKALSHPMASKVMFLPKVVLGITGIALTAVGIIKLVRLKSKD